MTPGVPARILQEDQITVTINGIAYNVPTTMSETTLADFLREHILVTGTKIMCREGGCGACTVLAAFPDPSGATQQMIQKSINSCLCPILSCDGWRITTVEGVGTQFKPHAIQTSLTDHYGTQCGYCTPGMIMRMYSLVQNNPNGTLTKQMVEDGFGGNLCRCTGYRPILEAFKSMASDGENCSRVTDVEDIVTRTCKKTGTKCLGKCHTNVQNSLIRELHVAQAGSAPKWYKPATLTELYALMPTLKGQNAYYVVGHTGIGVYPFDAPFGAYVNVKGIQELYAVKSTSDTFSIGAAVPLTDVIDLMNTQSSQPGFAYLKPVVANIAQTAHPSLRNVGSWGGNLAMKNRHKEFESDPFISFIISDAKLFIGPENALYTMDDFVQKLDVINDVKFIVRAEFPTWGSDYFIQAYKTAPRAANAHALVNAGIRARIKPGQSGQFVISEKPVLVFGAISATFTHATQTENYLAGKDIGDVQVLQQALSILNGEIQPDFIPNEASPAYKKSLCLSLFYKFALEIVGSSANPRYRSAIGHLQRPISSGTQSYTTRKDEWPLTQPMPKTESLVQCTGEAKYISDTEHADSYYAAFVLATVGNATVFSIDTTVAMGIEGVVRVFTYEDIPGVNNFNGEGVPAEPFLADKHVSYCGQPVAFVVAVTKALAELGARLVNVSYTNTVDSITTIKDAINAQSFFLPRPPDTVMGDPEKAIRDAPNKLSGELNIGYQAIFYMETMVCVSVPTEDGLDVEAGTQYIDATQAGMSRCLGISKNKY